MMEWVSRMGTTNTDPLPEEVKELNTWFYKMYSFRQQVYDDLVNDEQQYFSDVEGTRTQLNKKQLDEVKKKYDIPISTKLSWAIIEQMLSFLTGAKPYPRLIASSSQEVSKDFAIAYEKAVEAMWYESRMNRQLTDQIRDGLVTGLGWILIRPNDFYAESTFGVVGEYIDWRYVLVDPHSKKPDFSDAEMICIAEYLPSYKIEKQLGIRMSKEIGDYWTDLNVVPYDSSETDNFTAPNRYNHAHMPDNQDKYVYLWKRQYFKKIIKTVYVTEEGNVAKNRPTPIEVDNPEKIALGQMIEQMMMAAAQLSQQGDIVAQSHMQTEEVAQTGGPPGPAQETMSQMQAQTDQMNQLNMQLQQAQLAFADMPDKVTHYLYEPVSVDALPKKGPGTTTEMEAALKDKRITPSYRKVRRKVIESIVMAGNKIVDKQILPVDEYPIIPFNISHARSPRKNYGIMHYIKDIVKAMNKFWSLMIYDMQTNANRKVLYPKGAVINPAKVETQWAKPNAWIEYEPDASLPNGGAPTVLEPAPLNPAITNVMVLLQQLLEYSTGISAIVQGQNTPNSPMPDSFGGIQAYQSFGTQRIKLYSRSLQDTLERMIYVIASYLAAYAPKEKIIQYLDEDGNAQELELFEPSTDMRFKVRMNLQSNLPTQRAQAAQLLGIVSGQTQNPVVADLLTKYMLDYLDMPESRKMSEEVDLVKNMQSQLEQFQANSQDQNNKIAQLEQQLFQAELETKRVKAEMELEKELALRKQEIEGASEGELDTMDTKIEESPTEALPPQPPEDMSQEPPAVF